MTTLEEVFIRIGHGLVAEPDAHHGSPPSQPALTHSSAGDEKSHAAEPSTPSSPPDEHSTSTHDTNGHAHGEPLHFAVAPLTTDETLAHMPSAPVPPLSPAVVVFHRDSGAGDHTAIDVTPRDIEMQALGGANAATSSQPNSRRSSKVAPLPEVKLDNVHLERPTTGDASAHHTPRPSVSISKEHLNPHGTNGTHGELTARAPC